MAEAIGLVASVLQLAGTGLKLSQALYQYADAVANADRRIREVAKEIKLTSFVVEELGKIFKQHDTLSLMSETAVATANETIAECSTVFDDIEKTLNKSKKGKMGRFTLPFRENKIELLQSRIEKLKSSLQLLMQVLMHAYQVASNKFDREAEARQRDGIRRLIEKKKSSTEKYEELQRRFSMSDSSTAIEDDESSLDGDSVSDSMVNATAIGSSMSAESLAECAEHVRILLEDIGRLQHALANKSDGDDHSHHQQIAMGSYFTVRAHLDRVLLGKSSTVVLESTMKITPESLRMKAPAQFLDSEAGSGQKENETRTNVEETQMEVEETAAEEKMTTRLPLILHEVSRSSRPDAKAEQRRPNALFGGGRTYPDAIEPHRHPSGALSASPSYVQNSSQYTGDVDFGEEFVPDVIKQDASCQIGGK